ncbi:phosphoglycolate phosphatase [Rubricella aquisinus]|uniref:Phosphoglycolate phosphatase n=1 Tax=Rubricella aquisinus TaxID=2028108 RepID=A0A840X5G9_9RHOB|nr:HAD-IA family hydrolase [Rubricella aquisinus]MBB5517075.1 phosphoglycolate phosphatase [Rubricella aquisinus]
MSTALKLVVFDMDGTLIDSQALILFAMRAAFVSHDLEPPSDAETLSIVGLSLPRAIEELRPGLSQAANAALVDGYKTAFVAQRAASGGEASVPLYPGIRALLDRLAQDETMLLGVATGKARRGLDHVYAAHDLERYFVTSQTADFHPSKPHPAMLEHCLAETGVDPRDAVMIGDTSFDMEMGRAAGFGTVGVSWGYHPVRRLEDAGAHHVVHRAEEIDAAISKLLEGVT